MTRLHVALIVAIALVVSLVGCDQVAPQLQNGPSSSEADLQRRGGPPGGSPAAGLSGASYEFTPPVFDISTSPNGSILVAETFNAGSPRTTSSVKEITRRGIRAFTEITTAEGSPINGLHNVGRGNFFATSGGLDQAVGAGVWHVSRGQAQLIGDIETFEQDNDPDANEGLQWKVPDCEIDPSQGFTSGPQSNPYHLTRLTGSTALVADAAGNTLLSAKKKGELDWVAIFSPPVKDGVTEPSSTDPEDWRVLKTTAAGATCYVQPVPTSVAIGPDGDYYVGELIGALAEGEGLPVGLSRIWKISKGARNVTCPSSDCDVALSGFTSVIDVAAGPDGHLYIVEYDANSWLASVVPSISLGGGTISRCDPAADATKSDCEVVSSDLTLPAAIAFDKWGTLWLLENNLGFPFDGTPAMVRRVDVPTP